MRRHVKELGGTDAANVSRARCASGDVRAFMFSAHFMREIRELMRRQGARIDHAAREARATGRRAQMTATPPQQRAEPVPGSFLAALDDHQRSELEQLGVTRAFPRASMLMFEREPDERVVILLRGRVKVSRVDQSGRELMLDIGDAGDVLGELAFIDKQPRLATVVALEPVDALIISAGSLRAYLSTRPAINALLSEVIARRLRAAQVKRSQFTELDTMGRLAARLVELADRYGTAVDGGIEVRVPISQEELAAWTGASRAGVAQALQSLRELGWLQTARHQMLVRDIAALRARGAG